jgi:iron(III) transport system ATP-binding protein
VIRLSGVSKHFGGVAVISRVTLDVPEGELLALLGPSGCGKTTLLRLIAGFEQPDEGVVEVAGTVVAGPDVWVPPERRAVGMVFQDYALFPHLTVAENVAFGLPRRERRSRGAEVIALVGLAGLERRFPHQLSGGQQQRVALARALAPRPALMLLDEPWSNIDPHLRQTMRDEVAEILRHEGVTVVLVTHDREEAFSLADRVALMRDGELLQLGTPEALYRAPAGRWSAEFVGPANFLAGSSDGSTVTTAIGRFSVTGDTVRTGDVLAVVRPELIVLAPDPAASAEVVERQFRGHDIAFRVRLGDGSTLVVQRPSTEDVPLGTRVLVRAEGVREVSVIPSPPIT